MMRVVLDTNVLVSAVMGKALALVLDHWRAGDFVLVVSSDIVNEYITVLRRPKLGLPSQVVNDINAYLIRAAEFVVPQERLRVVTADPKDDQFLVEAFRKKGVGGVPHPLPPFFGTLSSHLKHTLLISS